MISLFHACCSTRLSRTGCLVTWSTPCGRFYHSWKASFQHSSVRTVNLGLSTRFQVQYYSKKSRGGSLLKPKGDPKPLMKDDREDFFVVRKGDLIGVYKSLIDCQAQVGTSILDPPVSVYKGCSMPKDTEKYLLSRGLKNALYSIRAADLTEELFGTLWHVLCSLLLGVKRLASLWQGRGHRKLYLQIMGNLVLLSLMVLQKEILDKLGQELYCDPTMEVLFVGCVKA